MSKHRKTFRIKLIIVSMKQKRQRLKAFCSETGNLSVKVLKSPRIFCSKRLRILVQALKQISVTKSKVKQTKSYILVWK